MLGVGLWGGAKGNSHMGKGHRSCHLCTLDMNLVFFFLFFFFIALDKIGRHIFFIFIFFHENLC